MKITKVEVFRLPTANSKQNSPIGCRIHTDVGICGDGEAGMAYGVGGSGAFGMVCDLAELIIGMDPLRTEFIWETMYKRTFWGQNGGPVVFSGIAAIDVALWDIKGKMMTWLLIAALILFAIVGIFKMKLPIFDFSDPSFAINGWGITFNNGQISGGFLGAVLLFVYSTQGYYMTTAYGRDSKNARKDIPFVLLLCVPTLCILYVGVAMAGVGVMSVEEYGNSTTLVFAAQRIFPTWLFYFFIIGGPIMALLSTLNSSFAYNSITIGQSCDDGWLPKSFGKKNKSGARPYILTFMYVVGIIPIVFGLSITTITNMVQLITSAFAILNFTAEIKMPKKYPDAWKQSRYHVPDGLYYTICCVSLALFLVVLWKSLLSMNIGLAVINVVVIVIAGLIGFWRSKTGNIEIHTSVWAEDYQEASES